MKIFLKIEKQLAILVKILYMLIKTMIFYIQIVEPMKTHI